MKRYTICVYAICKNEELFVDSWVDSMKEADLIVVTDTGSTDATVEKLHARGVIVYAEKIDPWRFDEARNRSLDHVPENVDICVCTDLDERFEPGWREKLEKAWMPDTKVGKYLYNWSLKPDGSPDMQFQYAKIHARKDFKWQYPVHEWLTYTGREPKKTVFIDGMVLNHYPDKTKPRSSYLPLLEMAVREDPEGERVNYYLGREYMYYGQWAKCIETLKRYLTLPSAFWNQQRCAAMRWIAKSYLELGDAVQAYSWYFRAVAEAPELRDPHIELAKAAYTLADWPTVFYMVERALKIPERSPTYVNMGYCWDETPYDLGAISCYRLGLYAKSIEYARKALEINPENPRLIDNLRIIREKAQSLGIV